MFDKYPYTDMHEMNLDWILTKIHELDVKVNSDLERLIREQLDKLFIDSMYIPETETLVLILKMEG